MKTARLFLLTSSALLVASPNAWAQSLPTISVTGDATYTISERGPHHRVWSKITARLDREGQAITETNVAYVELATGLHYWVSDPAPPQQIVLQTGTHLLRIKTETHDWRYHTGAYYQFNLSFDPP